MPLNVTHRYTDKSLGVILVATNIYRQSSFNTFRKGTGCKFAGEAHGRTVVSGNRKKNNRTIV